MKSPAFRCRPAPSTRRLQRRLRRGAPASEVVLLKVSDIDSARMLLRVEQVRGARTASQWRQHCEAVLAPLALLHAEQHARAVDIGDLQRHDFGSPEPRAVGDAQSRLILGAGRRIEKAGDFILGQDRGQLPGLLDPKQRLAEIVPVERDAEEEPQRNSWPSSHSLPKRALHKMETVEPQILRRRRFGRPADVGCEVLDAPDVVLLRLLSKMPRDHCPSCAGEAG